MSTNRDAKVRFQAKCGSKGRRARQSKPQRYKWLVLRVVNAFTFGCAGELWPCTWPMRWNYARVIVAGWIH
jgi:hypothetical protein